MLRIMKIVTQTGIFFVDTDLSLINSRFFSFGSIFMLYTLSMVFM
jgi:hypothetical protein